MSIGEAAHVTAVVAKLRAAGSSAYGVDELARLATKPAHYNEVHVAERNTDAYRVGATNGLRSYRVLILSVGVNYLDAQRERDLVTEALPEGSPLTVAGVETSAVHREASDDPLDFSNSVYSGVTERVYAIAS